MDKRQQDKTDDAGKTNINVPPARWSVERPFDSAEYLDRPAPTYAEPNRGDEEAVPEQ